MSSNLSDYEKDLERTEQRRARDPRRRRPGISNAKIGWVSLVLGASTGVVLGLWSFNGPVAVPEWLGEYDDLSRRLARLGHIAFFGLGILNILVARELPRLTLQSTCVTLASWTMNFGNIFLPTVLFAAAAWHPLKYLLPVPALSVTVALAIVAYGVWSRPEGQQ